MSREYRALTPSDPGATVTDISRVETTDYPVPHLPHFPRFGLPVIDDATEFYASITTGLVARRFAFGTVNTHVPGSLLQERATTYTMLGGLADDVRVEMA